MKDCFFDEIELYRRVDNGQMTTKEYALKHPNTTIHEKRKVVKKKWKRKKT